MTRNIAAMTHAPLGMRTVRRTSEESGLVTSPEGEGEGFLREASPLFDSPITPLTRESF